MKTIIRIAKTELRTLFYSPIAWFLLIVFLIQCGITYFAVLESQARTQELAGIGLQYMTRLTERIFTGQGGLFSSVMQKLYLFIPLLTMGLISRETSSGTIKLLYSSPIRVREIVFGKYLAMLIYNLLLVAIISVFMIAGMVHIKNADGGLLLSGAIGFYLLLCAYSAIGLFMSSLTTYQVVAAVCTFVMIGILSYIGTLWQDIDFVRDLTYFLSLNGRAEKMLVGLITTRDVLYFGVIVYIFLGLTIYKIKAGMESKPVWVKAGRYVAIVASALLIGYVFSLPVLTGYLDLTANKSRTLTPNAQKIIKDFGEEPLEVTAYNNLLDRFSYMGFPAQRNQDLARWEPYMRFKTNIRLHYVEYYDSALGASYMSKLYPGKSTKELAEQYSKSMGMKLAMFRTPEEIRKTIDLRPEMNRYVMQLKYKDRTTFLRVFDDQMVWPGETEVSAAFKRLQQARLPRVAFLTGDLERSIDKMGDRDYKALTNLSTFRYSLVNQGFDVDTITLDTRGIPADISTLVIADPKVSFSPVTMAKIKAYIDGGGNLLIAGEPGRQSVLNPLLQTLGVQLMEGQVVQQSQQFAPDLVTPELTSMAAGFTKTVAKSKEDSQKVSMPGVAGLTYGSGGDFTVEPLLRTDSKLSWNKKNKLDLDMVNTADASERGNAATTPVASQVGMMARGMVRPAGKPLPEEMKKRSDSIRTVINGIMTGAGTPDEKKQKMAELFAKLRSAPTAKRQASQDGSPAPGDSSRSSGSARQEGMKLVKKEKPAVAEQGSEPAAGVAGEKRSAFTGTVFFSAADGDTRGPVTTAVSLTRQINGKEQRIVVAGDADFMSNIELNRSNIRTANFGFNTALFSWLSYGDFPIDTSRPDAKDKRVTVSTDAVDRLKLIFLWVLPGILLACGIVLLIRRKRK